jgi:hypothetical protein
MARAKLLGPQMRKEKRQHEKTVQRERVTENLVSEKK